MASSNLSEKFLPLPTEEPTFVIADDTENGTVGMTSNSGMNAMPKQQQQSYLNASYAPVSTVSSGTTGLMVEHGGNINELNTNPTGSHLFCKYCCDCRRACLIVNIISIIMKIATIIVVAILGKYVTNNLEDIENDLDDDEIKKELDSTVKSGGVQIVEFILDIISMISIGLHACGIYGALKFKLWGIITAGSTYALLTIFGLFGFDFAAFLLGVIFLYPHIVMYKEMKEGIMTEYDYHKIAHCCGNRNM